MPSEIIIAKRMYSTSVAFTSAVYLAPGSTSSHWKAISMLRRSSFVTPSSSRVHLLCHKSTVNVQMISGEKSEQEPDASDSEMKTEEERKHLELLQNIAPKKLNWAEIPFASLQEELKAIDDYEIKEALDKDDVWPKFLRAAAYEHWGHPNLALSHYAKANTISGLRKVPQFWERQAYNLFKVGKVTEANAVIDIAGNVYEESAGNELHFVHWFQKAYEDFLPAWNGPSAPMQRGICKYCMNMHLAAKESLVAQIYLTERDRGHNILWFLAACAKNGPNATVSKVDVQVAKETLESLEKGYNYNPRLRLFIDLYVAHAQSLFGEVSEAEQKLSEAIREDGEDDLLDKIYIALYHDAFTEDSSERDRMLNEISALDISASSSIDTHNFLFCAAVNRFSPHGKNPAKDKKH